MCKKLPTRKEIRLKEYDYSKEGYYYITICTKNRKEILGKIDNNRKNVLNVGVGALDDPQIQLLQPGLIVEKHINRTNKIYSHIKIDTYVIMPNHIHMICNIQKNGSSGAPTPTNKTIPFFVSTFKRLINKELGKSIWQRNYYEHVIRDEKEYLLIKQYILDNIKNYKIDKYL